MLLHWPALRAYETSIWTAQVSDITPLAGLTRLERLTIRGTPVSEVGSLSNLTRLVIER
jgi:hypothetical protein